MMSKVEPNAFLQKQNQMLSKNGFGDKLDMDVFLLIYTYIDYNFIVVSGVNRNSQYLFKKQAKQEKKYKKSRERNYKHVLKELQYNIFYSERISLPVYRKFDIQISDDEYYSDNSSDEMNYNEIIWSD